jgi:hypothetical protein
MKIRPIVVVVAVFALAGCQAPLKPMPGMSAVRINVRAVPKIGRPAPGKPGYDQMAEPGSGSLERVNYDELGDIVVWLEPIDVTRVAPPGGVPPVIDLPGKPARDGLSAVVAVGAPIIFRNAGSAPFSAYCIGDAGDINLGTLQVGAEAQTVFQSPGLVEVLCESVPDPVARIYVAPSRWVSMTRSGATVDFNNVPPGSYRIVSWHPRLPGMTTNITLAPDQFVTSSVEVSVNRLPKIGPK